MNEKLLTIDEVATFLGVHRDTVYSLIKSGRLPALQLGGRKAGWRITQKDLSEFVEASKTNSGNRANGNGHRLEQFERQQAADLETFRDEQERARNVFLEDQKRPHDK